MTLKCATTSLICAVSINLGPPNFWKGIARLESSISSEYEILAFLARTQISDKLISSSNNSNILSFNYYILYSIYPQVARGKTIFFYVF